MIAINIQLKLFYLNQGMNNELPMNKIIGNRPRFFIENFSMKKITFSMIMLSWILQDLSQDFCQFPSENHYNYNYIYAQKLIEQKEGAVLPWLSRPQNYK